MVDRSYMLKQASPPSSIKVKLDQVVIPTLIDAAGMVETHMERAAVATRGSPIHSLIAAFGIGWLAAFMYKEGAARRRPRLSSG